MKNKCQAQLRSGAATTTTTTAHIFLPTIGDDGIPQSCSDAATFIWGFIVCANFLVFILVLPKICNGKTKGLAIHCVNQYTFPIYIRKCTCFSPTIGGDGSRQYPSVSAIFTAGLPLVSNFMSCFW